MGIYHSRAVYSSNRQFLHKCDVVFAMFIKCYKHVGVQFMLLSTMTKEIILEQYIDKWYADNSVKMKYTNISFDQHLHFIFVDVISILLSLAGDIESNPGPVTAHSRDLSICHINSQSMLSKLDLIAVELGIYDIITVSETWLDQTIENKDLILPNYQEPIRLDRNRHGGGVAAYFSKQVPFVERRELVLPNLEAIWAEVHLNNKQILIGTFYLHPRFDEWNLVQLAIDQAIQICPNIILLGDFNQDMLDLSKSRHIRDLMNIFNLNQVIDTPTRITQNTQTLIDLVLMTSSFNCTGKGVTDPFCSDHCPVFISTNFLTIKQQSYSRKIWCYDRANYDVYRQRLLGCNWNLTDKSVDENVTIISEHILNSADLSIPSKIVTIRPMDPPWMHNQIRKEIRERKKLHKLAKTYNNENDWARFRAQRNLVNNLVKDAKISHFKKLATSLQQGNLNSKQWWTVTKQDSDISCIIQNDNYYTTPHDKATTINNFFCSQSTVDDSHASLPPMELPAESLGIIQISTQDVEDVLKLLNVSKASGSDLISPRLLKEGAPVLSTHLANLFNKSIETSVFPSQWKLANVIPVHKKGDRTDASNYRPISLLSCLGKVFEKCVFKHMYNFLNNHNKITPVQSGFTPGDSAVYQLIDLYDTFCRALDDGKEVRVVFCDISKAFDRVWHRGLLFKLRRMGICGPLLNWFQSYLNNRLQRVALEGCVSDYREIKAGVPQGVNTWATFVPYIYQ